MLSNTKLKRAVRLRAMFGGAVDEQSIRADHSGARAKSRAGWARTAAPTSAPSVAEPALTRLQALDALRGFFGAPEGASSDDIRMRLADDTRLAADDTRLAAEDTPLAPEDLERARSSQLVEVDEVRVARDLEKARIRLDIPEYRHWPRSVCYTSSDGALVIDKGSSSDSDCEAGAHPPVHTRLLAGGVS